MSNAAMSTEDELLYSARDGIGHIVLNRPHRRNAMTFGMYDRIKEICARAGTADDPDGLKVLIFSGGGDAAFAAGTDISQFRTCLLYTSPSPRDVEESRMPSSA